MLLNIVAEESSWYCDKKAIAEVNDKTSKQ